MLLGATAALAAEEKLGDVSGYLGPEVYAKLEEVEIRSGVKAKRWVGPKLSFANYKRVLIDDVVLFPEPPTSEQVSQETIDKVVTYLTEKLIDKVGAVLVLSDEPGADVLRMSAAITGVDVKTEGMKAYEVVPVAAIFGGLKAVTGNRDRDVMVFLEVGLSDSVTGEMVGAAVRRIEGEQLKGTKEQLKLEHLKDSLDQTGDIAQEDLQQIMSGQQ